MRENVRKKNLENLIKLLAILAGMIFLFWLWLHRMESGKERPEPEGEKISIEDVHILLQALELPDSFEENDTEKSGTDSKEDGSEQRNLT